MQQLRTLKAWYGRNFSNWDGLAGLDQDLVHMDNHLPNITFAGAVAAGTATLAVAGTVPGIAQLFEDGTYAITSKNTAGNLVATAYAAKQGAMASDGAAVLICTGSRWHNHFLDLDAAASAAAASASAAAASANAMALSSASGVIGYASKALMDANLAHVDGTVAYVTNDATAANNSTYRKTGASGVGSWVKSVGDPVAQVVAMGALLRNQGANFPLKPTMRNATTSSASTIWNSLILDVKVYGAKAGFYYQLAFLQNEASIGGDTDQGWIINEFPISSFATASVATMIHNHSNAAPVIDRAGGVQTIQVIPASRSGMRFAITLDASKLPAAGTAINSNSSSAFAAWSWVIDPSCYVISDAAITVPDAVVKGLYVEGSAASKDFAFVFPHGKTKMMRVKLGINGFNALFNMKSVETAPLGSPKTASWTAVNSYTTDWFPPMVVQAVSNGDAAAAIYTGGNHGSNGDATGLTTAQMLEWRVEIDGKPLAATEVVAGYCDKVSFRWVNALCAYNTIASTRKVLHQTLVAHVHAGDIEAFCDITALEPIVVNTDNGLQMVTTGYQESCHFLEGVQQARVALTDAMTSGAKSVAPNAWADVCKSAANGFQISWMNRTYGAGDGRYVASTASYMRQGGAGNSKHYHAVVAAYSHSMATGDAYQWAGGYTWQPVDTVAGTNLDCAFIAKKMNKPMLTYAFLGAGAGTVATPDGLTGTVTTAGVVGVKGLAVTASGYSVQSLAL